MVTHHAREELAQGVGHPPRCESELSLQRPFLGPEEDAQFTLKFHREVLDSFQTSQKVKPGWRCAPLADREGRRGNPDVRVFSGHSLPGYRPADPFPAARGPLEVLPLAVQKPCCEAVSQPLGQRHAAHRSSQRRQAISPDYQRQGRRESSLPRPAPNARVEDAKYSPNSHRGAKIHGSLHRCRQRSPGRSKAAILGRVKRSDQPPKGYAADGGELCLNPIPLAHGRLPRRPGNREEVCERCSPRFRRIHETVFLLLPRDLKDLFGEKNVVSGSVMFTDRELRSAGFRHFLVSVGHFWWPDRRKVVATDDRPGRRCRLGGQGNVLEGETPRRGPGRLGPKEVNEIKQGPRRREAHHDPPPDRETVAIRQTSIQGTCQFSEDLLNLCRWRLSRTGEETIDKGRDQVLREQICSGSQVGGEADVLLLRRLLTVNPLGLSPEGPRVIPRQDALHAPVFPETTE
ncbi:hypothetical protein [Wenling narna-like virus 7]|uniref:hypothetical protein n=1 Tax=Wenling narna-like virus 7 TaxID=1923507 RepID=UPI00090C51AB|nr:hypothetical protein [Wenling narna-like virus 7]APG77260.1 hypothetical protein [Wenling narna-like virus 7]